MLCNPLCPALWLQTLTTLNGVTMDYPASLRGNPKP